MNITSWLAELTWPGMAGARARIGAYEVPKCQYIHEKSEDLRQQKRGNTLMICQNAKIHMRKVKISSTAAVGLGGLAGVAGLA